MSRKNPFRTGWSASVAPDDERPTEAEIRERIVRTTAEGIQTAQQAGNINSAAQQAADLRRTLFPAEEFTKPIINPQQNEQ